jgi:hypothetical protein
MCVHRFASAYNLFDSEAPDKGVWRCLYSQVLEVELTLGESRRAETTLEKSGLCKFGITS